MTSAALVTQVGDLAEARPISLDLGKPWRRSWAIPPLTRPCLGELACSHHQGCRTQPPSRAHETDSDALRNGGYGLDEWVMSVRFI